MMSRRIERMAGAFWCDDKGVTAIEYALLAALIAMAIVGAVGAVGDALTIFFDDVAQKVSDATP